MTLSLLGAKLLRRDWRAGELRALFLSIFIATLCISSMSLFGDRVQRAIKNQAAQLLGGDAVVSSNVKIPDLWVKYAEINNLKVARSNSFLSMISRKNNFSLAAIKSVGESYPLKGKLKISEREFTPGENTEEIPSQGTVWLQSRLFSQLDIKLGDTITVGKADLKVAKILTFEPDRAGQWLLIAPRVLMNQIDLPNTQIIQPGSRVRYDLLLSGAMSDITSFKKWLEPQLKEGQSFISIDDERRGLQDTLQRTFGYLNITAFISIILAGVAIAMTMHRYSDRHSKTAALFRCFGSRENDILQVFVANMLIISTIGIIFGSLLGFFLQTNLEVLFAPFLPTQLPKASMWEIKYSIITGYLIVLGFGLPPLLKLKKISPLQMLRKEAIKRLNINSSVYVFLFVFLYAMFLWQTRDIKLSAFLIGIFLSVSMLLVILGSISMNILASIRQTSLRFGLSNIIHRRNESIIHIVAFGLTLLVVTLLILLKHNLLFYWQEELPEKTPNYFVINVSPDQVEPFERLLKSKDIDSEDLYPLVRGRIVELNGQPIMQVISDDAKNHNALHRDLNLTWRVTLPNLNHIVSGEWWGKSQKKGVISVESTMAKRVGLKLGDYLGLQIGADKISAKIVNFRSLNWSSFTPNFFVIFSPGSLEGFPTTFMTSFYLPKERRSILNELVSEFPNLTLIDVDDILSRIRNIVGKANLAISYIVLFMFMIGFIVLYASIQMTIRSRQHETAIFRAMGATQKVVLKNLIIEFVCLGGIAGTISVITATVATWLLTYKIFLIPFQIQLWPFVFVPVFGAILVTSIGFFSSLPVLKTTPMRLLRTF